MRLKIGALLIGLLLISNSALAFKPSLNWILKKTASAQIERRISSLKIEQDLTLFGIKSAPRGYQTTQRAWLRAPYAVREEIRLPEGTRVSVYTQKRSLTVSPDGERKARKSGPNFFAHLIAGGGPNDSESLANRLLRDLEAYGVDTQKISYGRMDGRIAHVIGARPYEKTKPQVWIDKESYHPLRVVVAGKSAGKNIVRELRFSGWGSSEAGGWYPKIIERFDEGLLTERAVTKKAERNITLERGLFDTAQ